MSLLWEGWNPSPLGEAFRGLAVLCWCVWLPAQLAQCVPSALPLRVHDKVPQAGLTRARCAGRSSFGSGDLSSSGSGDLEGARSCGPCASVVECAAAVGAEPRDAADQGEDIASSIAGLPTVTQGVLGPTPLGSRVLCRFEWQCHRRGAQGVHRESRCRVPGRRFRHCGGVSAASPARSLGDFSRPSKPSPLGEGRSLKRTEGALRYEGFGGGP